MSFSFGLAVATGKRMYNSFLATHELSQLSKKILQGTSASSSLPLLALELSASPGPVRWIVKVPLQVRRFTGFILICSHDSNSTSAVGLLVHSTPALHLLSTVSLGAPGASQPALDSLSGSSSAFLLTSNPGTQPTLQSRHHQQSPKHTMGSCAPMPVHTSPLPAVSLELWGLPSQPSKLC